VRRDSSIFDADWPIGANSGGKKNGTVHFSLWNAIAKVNRPDYLESDFRNIVKLSKEMDTASVNSLHR
jgi:hypothetical protein